MRVLTSPQVCTTRVRVLACVEEAPHVFCEHECASVRYVLLTLNSHIRTKPTHLRACAQCVAFLIVIAAAAAVARPGSSSSDDISSRSIDSASNDLTVVIAVVIAACALSAL